MTDSSELTTSTIASVIISVTAALFVAMGLMAIYDPVYTLSFLSAGDLGADMRNEVRAVYGGFSIAMGIALFISLRRSPLGKGIVVTVAMAVGGMAAGRLISLTIEMPGTDWPIVFLAIEVVSAALLYLALRLDQVDPAAD